MTIAFEFPWLVLTHCFRQIDHLLYIMCCIITWKNAGKGIIFISECPSNCLTFHGFRTGVYFFHFHPSFLFFHSSYKFSQNTWSRVTRCQWRITIPVMYFLPFRITLYHISIAGQFNHPYCRKSLACG